METAYRKNIRQFLTRKKVFIYYHSQTGDTFPGHILAVNEKKGLAKIYYNGLEKNIVSWVKLKNVSLQEVSA